MKDEFVNVDERRNRSSRRDYCEDFGHYMH
jgi:hypothetical protein